MRTRLITDPRGAIEPLTSSKPICRPFGAELNGGARSQGLTPLATAGRPAGAEDDSPKLSRTRSEWLTAEADSPPRLAAREMGHRTRTHVPHSQGSVREVDPALAVEDAEVWRTVGEGLKKLRIARVKDEGRFGAMHGRAQRAKLIGLSVTHAQSADRLRTGIAGLSNHALENRLVVTGHAEELDGGGRAIRFEIPNVPAACNRSHRTSRVDRAG